MSGYALTALFKMHYPSRWEISELRTRAWAVRHTSSRVLILFPLESDCEQYYDKMIHYYFDISLEGLYLAKGSCAPLTRPCLWEIPFTHSEDLKKAY